MIQAVWSDTTASQVYKDSLAIRLEVFIEEQGYPDGSEIDELEEHTTHLVFYEEEQPIATTRIYQVEEKTYRIERVAVRNEERKRGLGDRLVKEAEAKIIELGGELITLKSEDTAIEFYKKHGYEPVGNEIIEYDYSHQKMIKEIGDQKNENNNKVDN